MLAIFSPFILSLYAIVFGTINYYHVGSNVYSFGSMANTIYVSIGLYLTLSVVFLLRYQNNVRSSTKNAILVAIFVQVIISLIQLNFPTMLLSGLGIVILITFIFYTLANPKEYIDRVTGTLNHFGLIIKLNDLFNTNKSFHVVTLLFDNWSVYHARFGEDFTVHICQGIEQRIKSVYPTDVFRTRTNCFNFIFYGIKKDCHDLEIQLEEAFTRPIHIVNSTIRPMPRMLTLECPKYADRQESIFKIIEMFMRKDLFPSAQTNCYIYDAQMDEVVKRYIAIEDMVKHAVDNDGFFIAYQPIYSTHEKRFVSCEALVRLKDMSSIGFVSPEEFVGVAERFGMIHQLGSIVFNKICQFIQAENPSQYGIDYIEVNLSAIQCMNPDLSYELIQTMEKYSIPPQFINFEITESAATLDMRTIYDNIHRLIKYGCSFSMDDYGTGFSNLASMTSMPYSIIKLDKSLIWPYFEGNQKLQVVLLSSISMIKNLGTQIVAEGVETKEQLDTLTELGVDYIQGYYFSKPISEQMFLTFIKQHLN